MPETAWKCDVCGAIYDEEDVAQKCEDGHVRSEHMQLHSLGYEDGGRFPATIVFRIDPNETDTDEDFFVRYVFDVAGPGLGSD